MTYKKCVIITLTCAGDSLRVCAFDYLNFFVSVFFVIKITGKHLQIRRETSRIDTVITTERFEDKLDPNPRNWTPKCHIHEGLRGRVDTHV